MPAIRPVRLGCPKLEKLKLIVVSALPKQSVQSSLVRPRTEPARKTLVKELYRYVHTENYVTAKHVASALPSADYCE